MKNMSRTNIQRWIFSAEKEIFFLCLLGGFKSVWPYLCIIYYIGYQISVK
jgi:hypothetical protein